MSTTPETITEDELAAEPDGQWLISNPRFTRESAAELTAAQQSLARKQRGSSNRRRAKAKVALAARSAIPRSTP